MVKIFCNRCGREIIGDHYYTINIYSYDVHPKPADYVTSADCANAYSKYDNDILARLNRIEMYCPDCIESIKEFIYNGVGAE